MKTATNKLLLALLIGQCTLIVGMRLSKGPTRQVLDEKIFSDLDKEGAVTRIRIESAPKAKAEDPAQEVVELAKEGTNWGIVSADLFPADATKVKDFVEKLSKLRARSTVLESATYHDKLEVSEKKFDRKITLTVGGKDETLFVGSSPSFKSVHVRRGGEDRVLMVSDFASSDAGARPWNWVKREYVDFVEGNVWAMTLKNKKGQIRVERDPVSKQWLAPDLKDPIDQATLNGLVQKASRINLEDPIGKEEKPAYGLAKPLAEVTLITGTSTIAGVPPPETKTTIIRVGAKSDVDNRYYVQASSSEYVVTTNAFAVEDLTEKGPKDIKAEANKADPKK
jgi:hypothetical protein